MRIFKAYKYLFYKIYDWQIRYFGEDDLPEIKTLVLVSLLNSANIYSIILLINLWTKFDLIDAINLGKIKMTIIYFSVLGVNYLLFIYRNYYKQLSKQFSDKDIRWKNIKLISTIVYIIFSLASPFILISITF